MRAFLVEDDTTLREGLADVLRRAGLAVELSGNGRDALTRLSEANVCELAIIDLGLPGLDGLDLVRLLRRRQPDLSIMIITARSGLHERIAGLDTGADDYLIKPFEIPEFEARVRAILRRHSLAQGAQLRVGPVAFRPGVPSVSAGGADITLSLGELAALELLASLAGNVVSREQLAARFSRDGLSPSNAAIEVAVHRLRRKLEPHGVKIRALRGFGYAIKVIENAHGG